MKPNRSLLWLLMVGSLLIGAALTVRQRYILVIVPRQEPLRVENTGTVTDQLALLENALSDSPDNVRMRWQLANLYGSTGDYGRAERELKRILRREPAFREAVLTLGNLYLACRRYAQAESVFRHARSHWQQTPEIAQGLASTLIAQGRYAEARQCGRLAVHLMPSDPNSHLILAMAALNEAAQSPEPQRRNAAALARNELEQMAERWPDNGEILMRLALACCLLKDRKAALTKARSAYTLMPGNEQAAILLASAERDAHHNASAREVAEAALAKHPASVILLDLLGQLWTESGQPGAMEKACDIYRKAVDLQPDSGLFLMRYAEACLQACEVRKGIAALEKAYWLDPCHAIMSRSANRLPVSLPPAF